MNLDSKYKLLTDKFDNTKLSSKIKQLIEERNFRGDKSTNIGYTI